MKNKIYVQNVLKRATTIYRIKKSLKGCPDNMLPEKLPSDQIAALAEALVEEINKAIENEK
jgi:hypothetical protein